MSDGLFNPEAFEQMPGQMSMEAVEPTFSGDQQQGETFADVLKRAGIGGKLAEIAEEPNPWL